MLLAIVSSCYTLSDRPAVCLTRISENCYLGQKERASQQLHLTIPAELNVRGQISTPPARSAVPVEEADPAVWYRYIQELVFSGQTEAAEQHLRRFRELHPDFVYQP